MKSYLKLVNFELDRFIKIYFVLVGVTIISQIIGTIYSAKHFMKEFEKAIYIEGLTTEQFLELNGKFGLIDLLGTGWFFYPMVFAAAVLIIYCIFIWYRDWFGKNTFIYRLLMLPTARINVFFAKATAIFMMVLGLSALQLILFKVTGRILQWLIPANLRIDMPIMEIVTSGYGNYHLGLLFPTSFMEFLIYYGVGFAAVIVLFTAILFERSYRLKGAVLGVLYAAAAVTVFLLPEILVIILEKNFLYPNETFIVYVILWTMITAFSIWLSNYLINKKVTI